MFRVQRPILLTAGIFTGVIDMVVSHMTQKLIFTLMNFPTGLSHPTIIEKMKRPFEFLT